MERDHWERAAASSAQRLRRRSRNAASAACEQPSVARRYDDMKCRCLRSDGSLAQLQPNSTSSLANAAVHACAHRLRLSELSFLSLSLSLSLSLPFS